MEVTVVEGDITRQQVDAIVNAANRRMRGGGGVDGAIHAAGGPAVLEDCIRRFPDGLATGDAGWTTAGDLPTRWVIHVVGPNHAAGERDRSLLTSCYRRALEVADELGARTVAFPLVSRRDLRLAQGGRGRRGRRDAARHAHAGRRGPDRGARPGDGTTSSPAGSDDKPEAAVGAAHYPHALEV
ncbi:macro domain-containing protein [Nocardioides sp. TF02-7]|uniref:macro domain-containing protein n=1 Tax=Nocardioides sp. TF02-7 TaxID=2917724 RepID=UPI001F0538C3|nr:macro domain-containing protein [Nocardioides sp. TF02-7]UMG93749.1 macro domain-containing protein [Nocardioides sp. TF02-7]